MSNLSPIKLAVFFAHIQEAANQTGQSIETLLKEVKSFGIEALEFDYEVLSAQEEFYQKLLHDMGFSVSSIYRFYDFGKKTVQPNDYVLIDLAVRFGSQRVMAIPGFYASSDASGRELELQCMIENIKKLVSYGQSKGIQVLMEDFDDCNSPFCTLDGLYRLMTEVPGIECTFDTGNFIYDTHSGLEALPKMLPYIRHVHFKDRMTDFSPASVGSGVMQIEEILKLLLDNGYQGYVSIEHFGAPDQPEYIRQSAQWILSQIASC